MTNEAFHLRMIISHARIYLIMRKKYFIRTFGCQMNEAESERIAGVFEDQDYKEAKKITEADVVVINTCSVRESAENRVFGLVNNLLKKKTKGNMIVL